MLRFLLILLICPVLAFGQNVTPQGATNQVNYQRGGNGADTAMVIPIYADTSKANNYPNLRKEARIIYTRSPKAFWYNDAQKWVRTASTGDLELDWQDVLDNGNVVIYSGTDTVYTIKSSDPDLYGWMVAGGDPDNEGLFRLRIGNITNGAYLSPLQFRLTDTASTYESVIDPGAFTAQANGGVKITTVKADSISTNGKAGYSNNPAYSSLAPNHWVTKGMVEYYQDSADNYIDSMSFDSVNYVIHYYYRHDLTSTPSTIQVYTSGGAVSINSGITWLIVNPASTEGTLQITLPLLPAQSEVVYISFGGTIATGTVISNLTIVGNVLESTTPSLLEAGDNLTYKFYNGNWYRL